jgi:hypothetical protein
MVLHQSEVCACTNELQALGHLANRAYLMHLLHPEQPFSATLLGTTLTLQIEDEPAQIHLSPAYLFY